MAFKRVIIRRVGPLSWLLGLLEKAVHLLKNLLIVCLLVLFISSCSLSVSSDPDEEQEPPTPAAWSAWPAWLVARMKEYAGVQLWKFQHNGESAYYIVSGDADGENTVFTASGAYICSPSGGHTVGDGKCPSTALADPGTKIILVWSDPIVTADEYAPPRLDIPTERSYDAAID